PLLDTTIGLGVNIISLVVTLVLIIFQRHVAKKTGSQAILADSAHYLVDILTNGAIIISLFAIKFYNAIWIDPLTATLISLYLLYNAYTLACDAIGLLLDRELSEDIRCQICNIVMSNSFVCGIHDLRTHDLGGGYMFEFHLELNGNLTLCQAHEYSDIITDKLKEAYPNAQIIIHQDPSGIYEDRLDNHL
ncbi:MAG: cation diffusion facilitator family transporter, partial [Alphaproteobacteria bacterium]|nr:cation diffusion facilitator family transporter [Alphaproteobacteria bacterium]